MIAADYRQKDEPDGSVSRETSPGTLFFPVIPRRFVQELDAVFFPERINRGAVR